MAIDHNSGAIPIPRDRRHRTNVAEFRTTAGDREDRTMRYRAPSAAAVTCVKTRKRSQPSCPSAICRRLLLRPKFLYCRCRRTVPEPVGSSPAMATTPTEVDNHRRSLRRHRRLQTCRHVCSGKWTWLANNCNSRRNHPFSPTLHHHPPHPLVIMTVIGERLPTIRIGPSTRGRRRRRQHLKVPIGE